MTFKNEIFYQFYHIYQFSFKDLLSILNDDSSCMASTVFSSRSICTGSIELPPDIVARMFPMSLSYSLRFSLKSSNSGPSGTFCSWVLRKSQMLIKEKLSWRNTKFRRQTFLRYFNMTKNVHTFKKDFHTTIINITVKLILVADLC